MWLMTYHRRRLAVDSAGRAREVLDWSWRGTTEEIVQLDSAEQGLSRRVVIYVK